MSTGRAHPQPSRGGPRLGPVAGGAHELLPPAEPRQVLAARLLGREAGFELPERARVVLHSLNHYRLGLLESRTYPQVGIWVGDKPIPDTADRLEMLGPGRLFLDGSAQPGNEVVDGSGVGVLPDTPDLLQ